MHRRAATVAAVLWSVAGGPGPADAGDAAALRTGGVDARLAEASTARAKDVRALGAALAALGETRGAASEDVEFLVAFLAGEPSRALRTLAADAAQRIDAKAAEVAHDDRAGSESDSTRAAACVEAAGLMAGRDRARDFAEFLGHRSGLVVAAAADALARIGAKSDAPALADKGLSHAWEPATYRCAWAVLDLVGDRAKTASAFLPQSADVPIALAARISAVQSLLADTQLAPHKWTPPLAAARKALMTAPRELKAGALNPRMQRWMDDGLAWLRGHAPAEHWLVCASLESISYRSDGATRLDADARRLDLSYDDAGLPPPRFANLVLRHAGIAWRKRVGEPWEGPRAWHGAVADSFDLCVAGRLDGASEKTASREKFIERALELRPWEAR